MICNRIDLYEYFGIARPEGAMCYLDAYLRDDSYVKQIQPSLPDRKRPAMLVIGGGGYEYVSGRETEPIAITYMDMGFHTFCLYYSVKPAHYPTQLIEACMAMLYIKQCAGEYNVDTDHVCASGFSAGGHLCGMLATMYNERAVVEVLGDKAKLCRPDAIILAYPVISSGEYAHKESFENLSGNNEKLTKELSLEFKVTKDTPPAFIWSTSSDGAVPCENSILMALAYRKVGTPIELHVFEPGIHGLSTCDEESYTPEPTVRPWIKLSKTWLKRKGFIVKDI